MPLSRAAQSGLVEFQQPDTLGVVNNFFHPHTGPVAPGQGFIPLGNLLTSDFAGPYNLSLLSVQENEIKGAARLHFCKVGFSSCWCRQTKFVLAKDEPPQVGKLLSRCGRGMKGQSMVREWCYHHCGKDLLTMHVYVGVHSEQEWHTHA